eukprot:TRINITY_DN2772_c0_g1_i1.p1 TRINITY_DN2772_c0_g1~~TRINITY_DN2772_c0_g1_i1.p1  ORF type:complete len:143 (+),score=34.11 TRINITY_DN2772_c0_g1_i1:26-430(+)
MPVTIAQDTTSTKLAVRVRAGTAVAAKIVYSLLVDVDQQQLGPVLSHDRSDKGKVITYQADFSVSQACQTVEVALAQFRPTCRGRTVDAAPTLTWGMVTGLGFTVLRSRQLLKPRQGQMDKFDLRVEPACWRLV